MIVSPSILAADFNCLPQEIEKINQSNCEFIHLDVMDGKFVPNTTFDEKLIASIRNQSSKAFDVHLMIEKPDLQLKKYLQAGADYLTFHYEAAHNLRQSIDIIHRANKKAGISIKPGTDVKVLLPYLSLLDLVLVMSVEPGFGGQSFMDSSLDKITYLAEQKRLFGHHYLIEVDGGINQKTAQLVKNVGCEVVVAGTYLFKSLNFSEAVEGLKEI